MSNLALTLLAALLAADQPAAVSNLVHAATGVKVSVPDPNDPVAVEYHRILLEDQEAQDEVDRWIDESRNSNEPEVQGAPALLRTRILKRFDPVKESYESFLRRHPKHVDARLAYGSFLDETGEAPKAEEQWEKARKTDPKNPAAWNNLANHYGHFGPVKKAFEYYARAIELDPKEAGYCRNLATTVYLFRKDAREFYKCSEPQVFERALGLYRRACDLEPDNFLYAQDLAQSYYGIKPPKLDDPEAERIARANHFKEALDAWDSALKIARDETERQGVYIHIARTQISAGNYTAARERLNAVSLEMLDSLKNRLLKNLDVKEGKATPPPEPP